LPDVVADTHALVWHLTAPRRLGRKARRAFAAADDGRWLCRVPVIAIVEISLLHERGRLRIGPSQVLAAIGAHPGYALLPLDVEQALEFDRLPGVKDPMDRLILAAARVTGSKLVTVDDAFADQGVEILWD
jgi:PIN domain nuclease of toxin-antitoxin system